MTVIVIALVAASTAGEQVRETSKGLQPLRQIDDPVATTTRALARHPSDYIIAGLTAQAMFHKRDPRAARLLNYALYLHPRHSALHYLAGRMLETSQNPSQAMVNYKKALETANDPTPILKSILAKAKSQEQILKALPLSPKHTLAIAPILTTLHPGDLSLRYALRTREKFPTNPRLLALVTRLALSAKQLATALDAATQTYLLSPTASHLLLAAWTMTASGQFVSAQNLLEEGIQRAQKQININDLGNLQLALGTLQFQRKQFELARNTAMRAMSTGSNSKTILIRAHSLLATIEAKLGNTNRARWHRTRLKTLKSD